MGALEWFALAGFGLFVFAGHAVVVVEQEWQRFGKIREADWKGKLERKWRFLKWRREWGRWCYNTNAHGDTLKSYFEWEHP